MDEPDLPVGSISAAEFIHLEDLPPVTQSTTAVRMVMLMYFRLHPGISGPGSFLLLQN